MTKEEKELLKKVLCEQLPYGLRVEIEGYHSGILKGIEGDTISTERGINYPLRLVRPYLRPWSSMTEEESKEFALLQTDFYVSGFLYPSAAINMVNWINAHHFDPLSGLIEKGLAIAAVGNDNPYKEKGGIGR